MCVLLLFTYAFADETKSVTDTHYSMVKGYMKGEMESADDMINSIKKLIDMELKKPASAVNNITKADSVRLMQMQLEESQSEYEQFKEAKKQIKNAKKHMQNFLRTADGKRLMEKELMRQVDRDVTVQQNIQQVSGDNQQDKRIKIYAKAIEDSLNYQLNIIKGCHSKDCEAIRTVLKANIETLQKTYKKYVKGTLKMFKELIKEMQSLKYEYMRKVHARRATNQEQWNARIKELSKSIDDYKKKEIEVKGIHSEMLGTIKREEEERKRVILNKYLETTDEVEKTKLKLGESQAELKKIVGVLEQRDVFVPHRFRLIQRRDLLKKVIRELRQYRKNVLLPGFKRTLKDFEESRSKQLEEVKKAIQKKYRMMQMLDREDAKRNLEIKELQKQQVYDTTLKSVNGLKEKTLETRRSTRDRKETMEQIKHLEDEKRKLLLTVGLYKREVAIKKIMQKLGDIHSKIESAISRGVEARNKIESLKKKEPSTCVIKAIENYQNMLKRAQKDQTRLQHIREHISFVHKKLLLKQLKFFNALEKQLKRIRKHTVIRRNEYEQKLIHANGQTSSDEFSNKMEIAESAIESLDKALLKLENRRQRLVKMVGHINAFRSQPKNVYCKKTWRCNSCMHLAEIAQIGLVKHKGDAWAMHKAKQHCEGFDGKKKELCYKQSFDVFTAATHINDPMKFDAKAICSRFNHC